MSGLQRLHTNWPALKFGIIASLPLGDIVNRRQRRQHGNFEVRYATDAKATVHDWPGLDGLRPDFVLAGHARGSILDPGRLRSTTPTGSHRVRDDTIASEPVNFRMCPGRRFENA